MKKFRYILTAVILSAMLTACGGDAAETETSAETTTSTASETTTEATTTTVTTTTPSETTETTTVTTVLPFEDTTDNAYQRLYAAFMTDDGIVFPDDYAGTYGYAGTLFVVITENEPSDFYTGLLADYTCIEYKTAKLSFNKLMEISREAAELLEDEFGVAECFVDVPTNKAGISIINGDPKKAQNYLKTVEKKSFTLDQLEISMAEADLTEAVQ